jgi:hypothetical protein
MSKKRRPPALDVRFRSNKSLRRRSGNRPPRPAVLIACEGKETEPNYFKSLRNSLKLGTVQVEVAGVGAAPITVVDQALVKRDERQRAAEETMLAGGIGMPGFDEVWCVFDREGPTGNPSYYQAVNKARDNGLELAVSNPAFEFWFLLHFEETCRPFCGADEVIRMLKNHVPSYTKSMDVYPLISPRTEEAIARARRVSEEHARSGGSDNPSTTVHRLVEKLRSMRGN